MKVNKDYIVKEVLGSKVLIHLNNDSSSIFKLNNTSFDIYNLLCLNYSKEEIINSLMNKYDVNKDTLIKDYNELIDELVLRGILINE